MASPSFTPAAQAAHDPGAATSLLRTPSGPTIPLAKLAPEAALRRLELTVVRRLEGFLHGDHLGLLPGPGSDTNDARDTMADRELEVWGLLDVTPSMNWGTEGVTKRDLGIAAIATIGFLSQRMGDRFGGMLLLPDRVKRLPARSGRTALYGMLRQMLTEPIVPDNASGDLELADGIEQLARSQRRRGMRVVVSDFLTAGEAELDPDRPPAWERAIRRLAVRNQVLCVEVVDRHELEFPDVGEMLIRDPETSFLRYINTSDPVARQRMDEASRAQRERIKVALRRAGAGHIQLRTDRDWVADIARFVLGYRRVAGMLHKPPQGVSR